MFDIIELEQGTKEWLDWRMGGITATDASIINGSNKYQSIDDLFRLKTFKKSHEFIENDATRQGSALEPLVRDLTNKHFAEVFQPICVQSKKNPFLLASLDGISYDKKILLEIKCPSHFYTHKKNSTCFNGWDTEKDCDLIVPDIPEYYYTQVQHQLMITGAEQCVFASYLEGDLKFNFIYPDEKYQKSLYKQCLKFWKKVQATRRKDARG